MSNEVIPYKTINVLGKRWYIVVDKKELDGDNYGECSYQKKQIAIDHELPDDEMLQVFFHELVHAISFQSGIRFSDALTPEMEEVFCESISNCIMQNRKKLKKIL